MKKLTGCFFLTGDIDKIDLCVVGIEVHLYLYLVFYLSQFSRLKSIVFTEQLAIGQQITFDKSVII